MKRSLLPIAIIGALLHTSLLSAAQLDDLYGPIIKPGMHLLTTQGKYYTMWQRGHHGSASFDVFESRPHTESLSNALRFSPVNNWDITLGYQYTFPEHDIRPTQNNAGTVTSYQNYFIGGGHDYSLLARYRRKETEYYLDVLEKRNKTSWDFATSHTVAPIFFNYFQSNFEDVRLGIRLVQERLSSEWELGYKNGRLNRNGVFYVADNQYRSYQHRTHEHFIPRVLLCYGLSDAMQVQGGITYTSPMRYVYDFRQYKNSGLTNFISGTYTWDRAIEIPIKFDYRPSPNWFTAIGLDYKYIHQAFNYWEKAENGTLTDYPSKKLDYYNLKPRIDLSFTTTPKHDPWAPDIALMGKPQLVKDQWKISIYVLKDVTILKKNASNGAQNIVDPYDVYQYPSENYVSGTEYSAFFSGNTALTPANIAPQDYVQVGGAFNYGINDRLELGLGGGYRSENNLHQFSLNDKSDRYYIFRPYYYVDVSAKYNLTRSSQLSLGVHLVPDYNTVLWTTSNPEGFTAHSRYLEATLTFKKSF